MAEEKAILDIIGSPLSPEDTFIDELLVPDYLNELDPTEEDDFKLRTLVDFEVTDKQGRLVSLHDFPKRTDRAELILKGYVIEPLDINFRIALTNCASSAESNTVASPEEALGAGINTTFIPEERTKEEIEMSELQWKLDKQFLLVPGYQLDGYCNKTNKWFPAKVVAIRGDDVKIHFKGWNIKHDEWISRSSDRLAPYCSSSKSVYDAARKAEMMVPWYETERLYAQAEHIQIITGNTSGSDSGTAENKSSKKAGVHHPYPQGMLDKTLRKQAVVITGVQDWCIDLSYCTPSLWIISTNEIWYRVAGLFCPNGHLGFPSKRYTPVFDAFVSHFEVCAHISYVLLDFYGQNSKLSCQDVIAEVHARSKGGISESTFILAAPLTIGQLENLPLNPDWDKACKPFRESLFVQQLRKFHTQAQILLQKAQAKKMLEAAGKPIAGPGSRGGKQGMSATAMLKMRENFLKTNMLGGDSASSGSSRGVSSKISAAYDEVYKNDPVQQARMTFLIHTKLHKPSKMIYPISDADHWEMQFLMHHIYPPASMSPQTTQLACPVELTLPLLQTWCTFMNFRALIDAPYVSLDRFSSLLGLDRINSSTSTKTLVVESFLREIYCRLLAITMVDSNFVCHTNFGLFEFLPIVNGASFRNDINKEMYSTGCTRNDFISRHTTQHKCFNTSQDFPLSDPKVSNAAALLRYGDTWAEVLMMFLAQRANIPISEYVDALSGVTDALLEIIDDPNAMPYVNPVRPIDDGVPDYMSIVETPMCLQNIRYRIIKGYYDDKEDLSNDGAYLVKSDSKQESKGKDENEDEDEEIISSNTRTNSKLAPTSTQHCGASGILQDVRLVWDNCRKYWNSVPLIEGQDEHFMIRLTAEMEEKFNKAVERYAGANTPSPSPSPSPVTSPSAPIKSEPETLKSGSSSTDTTLNLCPLSISKKLPKAVLAPSKLADVSPADIYQKMRASSIETVNDIQIVSHLHALRWLLIEFSRTSVARNHIELVSIAQAAAAKGASGGGRGTKSAGTGAGGEEDASGANPLVKKKPGRKPGFSVAEHTLKAAKKKQEGEEEGEGENKDADINVDVDADVDADADGDVDTNPPKNGKVAYTGRKRGPPKKDPSDSSAVIAVNPSQMEHYEYNRDVDLNGNAKYARFVPLGKGDRHGKRYWAFCFARLPLTTNMIKFYKESKTESKVKVNKIVSSGAERGEAAGVDTDDEELSGTMKIESADFTQENADTDTEAHPVPAVVLGTDAMRLFREDPFTGEWCVFSSKWEIEQLIEWLDPRGRNEKSTKDSLTFWLSQCDYTLSDKPQFPLKKEEILETVADNKVEVRVGAKAGTCGSGGEETDSDVDVGIVDVTQSGLKRARLILNGNGSGNGSGSANDKDVTIRDDMKMDTGMQMLGTTGNASVSSASSVPALATHAHVRSLSDGHLSFWHPHEYCSLAYNCRVIYRGALGMGVKETKEIHRGRKIVVVSYTQNGDFSAAYESGICIGDRVIACNGIPLHSIQEFQIAIKKAKDSSLNTPNDPADPTCIILDLMVLRSSDQLSRIDSEYTDTNIVLAAESYDPRRCNLKTEDGNRTGDNMCPTRAIGLIADLLHRCCPSDPFADAHIATLSAILSDCNAKSMSSLNSSKWKQRASCTVMATADNKKSKDSKIAILQRILLELDSYVFRNMNANQKRLKYDKRDMCPSWYQDERIRQHWRKVVSSTTRYSSLCACAATLSLAINATVVELLP